MDTFTIINYQGSKKNLLEFIHSNLNQYMNENDVLLDIFAGTSSVAYSYKRTNTVYANDAEEYASTMARALLCSDADTLKKIEDLKGAYANYENPDSRYEEWIVEEAKAVEEEDIDCLEDLYERMPTVWKSGTKWFAHKEEYSLFVKYYSTSYFGIKQARDIDALRKAIDTNGGKVKDIYLAALFYAMKECVLSKDGHMAQPLDIKKNKTRLFKLRKKDIYALFLQKLNDFKGDEFVRGKEGNRVFKFNFEDLLEKKDLLQDVTVFYADPPYTDMQYSRYYHILNTVVEYDYPDVTKNGSNYTKGLYLENRFQSQLSQKSKCMGAMEKLISYSKEHNITLAISFAYPKNVETQKIDRYVIDIEDLIEKCKKYYSSSKVHVLTQSYKHSNNRNSETKKVLEYLIICEREGI